MEKNSNLKKAVSMLKKQNFHCQFADENCVAISIDRHSKTFAYLIVERDQFPGIVLSLACDFPDTYTVADLTIGLMHITQVALGEAFFRSKNGSLYWGSDAMKYFALEYDNLLLNDLIPITDSIN